MTQARQEKNQWLALARVEMTTLSALRWRNRERDVEPVVVTGSVRFIGGVDVGTGMSGIRALYSHERGAIMIGWFKAVRGRNWRKPQSASTTGPSDVRVLERGNDLIILSAHPSEASARAWLKARHTFTLPEWEPR